jgi:ABC-type multidrug transport system permease subunit
MIIAGMELAETAGNIAQLLFSLTLIFNGVLVPYNVLPGFWKFMYRVSPFTVSLFTHHHSAGRAD